MSVWVGCKRTLTHIDASVKAGFMSDRFWQIWVLMLTPRCLGWDVFICLLFPPLWFWLVLIHVKGLNWSLATSSPCQLKGLQSAKVAASRSLRWSFPPDVPT
jgi:hypothetical protein